jgi:hypothetical protein
MSEEWIGKPIITYEHLDDIKISQGPFCIWHPDKGWIEFDSVTREDWDRISDGKSPYVTLASKDDEG